MQSIWKNAITIISTVMVVLFISVILHKDDPYNLKLEKLKQQYALKPVSSIDHQKLSVLQRNFESPQEVTEACISCHTERHIEIMNSSHWNWERVSYIEGRGIKSTGKKNVINNFCIGSKGNEKACSKCHIGFGMTNDKFDFKNARNVDCMVCHDNSEEYLKGSAMAGYPDRTVNLQKVAQSVGQPKKMNCGSCHFYSGGGNNVKHGDLEEIQLACSREIDVHMASNGMDMTCVACHTAENHQMLGKMYSVSSNNINRSTCEQCHTGSPHFSDMLNRHNAKVSCQACHIPEYAKANATKMVWNWSDAGKLKNGKPYEKFDEDGNVVYASIKGSFVWDKNVIPDYIWFNGTANHYLAGDTITSSPVMINELFGTHDDKESKITPVKMHYGNQIYDKKNKILIQPKLFSSEENDSAFWKYFNWDEAARAGMNRVGLPYSGAYEFIETKMYWPINHMVAPKEQSVSCAECHTRNNGRLANLTGFYLPGRDHHKPIDIIGYILLFIAICGVLIHAVLRIITSIRKREYTSEVINYNDQ